MNIAIPYGRGHLHLEVEDSRVNAVLSSRLESYVPTRGERALVEEAMANPIGTEKLEQLVQGKEKIVLIASDHTRPVPSKVLIPPMLSAIRRGNPDAELTILIATGCHRGTTKEELVEKFGAEIVESEKIVIHDCTAEEDMVTIGTLPSGGALRINKIAAQADLLISEGFIEPHFFAGFSGGRKSVLPGIASQATVRWNHNADFIASPFARTGILEGNPIHEDMIYAARAAKLAFICNVVINAKHEVVGAFAGDVAQAHLAGVDFLRSLCQCEKVPADIVFSSNNGYPLDQNIYQAVKGMTAAEATVKQGGVIIMLARCNDGIGGDHFYRQLAQEPDIDKTMALFLSRGKEQTVPDQWQTQVFLRVLKKATVIFLSEMDDATIREMHMLPAKTMEEALQKAKAILKMENPKIVAIPGGISVIVK